MKVEYYLLSKKLGQKYCKYKGDSLKLSKDIPYTVDEVIVGVKGSLDKERRITTYRNSRGEIIERAFDYYDKPFKNRLYSRESNVISEEDIVTSTTVNEFILPRKLLGMFNQFRGFKPGLEDMFLSYKKNVTHHVAENINTGDKVVSEVSILPKTPVIYKTHKYIEYPHIVNGKRIKK